jgi:hypothetical protein
MATVSEIVQSFKRCDLACEDLARRYEAAFDDLAKTMEPGERIEVLAPCQLWRLLIATNRGIYVMTTATRSGRAKLEGVVPFERIQHFQYRDGWLRKWSGSMSYLNHEGGGNFWSAVHKKQGRMFAAYVREVLNARTADDRLGGTIFTAGAGLQAIGRSNTVEATSNSQQPHGNSTADVPPSRPDGSEVPAPIIRAIREGTGEEARRLINDAGIDINSRGPTGMTLLCYAAGAEGKWRLVEWLIQRGADVARGNAKQQTPLHLAAAFGNLESAQLLLQAGAQANAVDADGFTPTDVAEAAHHPEVMALLVSHGGSITLSNR